MKIDDKLFWGCVRGKHIIYERIDSEFLGSTSAQVGSLSPSGRMVNLSGTWFDLKNIKVKDVLNEMP